MFRGHDDSVTSAVFSPDGSQILTASADNTARLWDVKNHLLTMFQHKKEFPDEEFQVRGDHNEVTSAVFSPDSSQILTASTDQTARLWDIKGNLLAEFQHLYDVNSAVFSPDGSQILTASSDGSARLWDTKGNLLAEFQHDHYVTSAIFSPDGSNNNCWIKTQSYYNMP